MREILTGIAFVFSFVFSACQSDMAPIHPTLSEMDRQMTDIIPLPASLINGRTKIDVSKGIYIVPALLPTPIVSASIERFINQMKAIGVSTSDPSAISLNIEITDPSPMSLDLQIDESYRLEVHEESIELTSANFVGLNHGLATLGQLLHGSANTQTIQEASIYDIPLYPWRGIMIDVSRHWIPKEVIKKNLDAMAVAKMNVLHLHLSDDQGFRVVSKKFPRLSSEGSSGKYYDHDDIIEIVRYAYERGIRVIPEFDMPGHITSWLVAYPELGAELKKYELATDFGIQPNLLNPTSEKTYAFIKILLEEMSTLFPDDYIHVGGDEINLDQWEDNDEIRQFMNDNDLVSTQQLLAYFHLRVQRIVRDLGKKMMAWNEALRPELIKEGTLFQSWHGHDALFRSARMGFNGILSSGWYLDHKLPMSEMYKVDPVFDPNFIEITPDSSHWEMWETASTINGTPSNGALVLFGKNNQLRGVLQLMNRSIPFENASLINDQLKFELNAGFGALSVDIDLTDEQFLDGSMKLANMAISLKGHKVGGNDMPNGLPLPVFSTSPPLTDQEKQRILGGEACMWSEWVDQNNIISRIWPGSAAIAEKLWSPSEHTKDIDDFYRRSESFSKYVKIVGADYSEHRESFITDITEEISRGDLYTFVEALEEVKYYDRFTSTMVHTTDEPLDKIADAVLPESMTSYKFGQLVDIMHQKGPTEKSKEEIINQLISWIPVYKNLEDAFGSEEKLARVEVLALSLSDLSKIAAHVMESGILTEEEATYYSQLKANAVRKIDGVLLAPAPHLIRLIDRFRSEL